METKKVSCKLIGESGNIFHITSRAENALRNNGQREYALKMRERVLASNDYDKALAIIQEYVDIC